MQIRFVVCVLKIIIICDDDDCFGDATGCVENDERASDGRHVEN